MSSLEKKLVKLEEEIQRLEFEKEKISLEFTKAGEKNDVDELLRLQELLDSTDLEIMEKLEEWENSEAELNTLKN